jgi:hypothetical protein
MGLGMDALEDLASAKRSTHFSLIPIYYRYVLFLRWVDEQNSLKITVKMGHVSWPLRLETRLSLCYYPSVEYPFPPVGIVGAADGKNRRAFLSLEVPVLTPGNGRVFPTPLNTTNLLRIFQGNPKNQNFSDGRFLSANFFNTGGFERAESSTAAAPDGLKM